MSIFGGLTKKARRDLALALADIALEAGAAVMAIYNSGCVAVKKGDGSPLTEADLAADDVIHQRLAALWPEVSVLSEETADLIDPGSLGNRFFVVDPLDGTKEFIKRRGDFTINIALVEGGVAQVGAVFAPARSELWLAGDQAYYCRIKPGENISLDNLVVIQCQPDPKPPLRVVTSISHHDEETDRFLCALKRCEKLSVGSSLKFCLVADGRADIYPRFGPTMVWDTAAGQAVVSAAGGTVLQTDGSPLTVAHTSNGWRNGPIICWGCPSLGRRLNPELKTTSAARLTSDGGLLAGVS